MELPPKVLSLFSCNGAVSQHLHLTVLYHCIYLPGDVHDTQCWQVFYDCICLWHCDISLYMPSVCVTMLHHRIEICLWLYGSFCDSEHNCMAPLDSAASIAVCLPVSMIVLYQWLWCPSNSAVSVAVYYTSLWQGGISSCMSCPCDIALLLAVYAPVIMRYQ